MPSAQLTTSRSASPTPSDIFDESADELDEGMIEDLEETDIKLSLIEEQVCKEAGSTPADESAVLAEVAGLKAALEIQSTGIPLADLTRYLPRLSAPTKVALQASKEQCARACQKVLESFHHGCTLLSQATINPDGKPLPPSLPRRLEDFPLPVGRITPHRPSLLPLLSSPPSPASQNDSTLPPSPLLPRAVEIGGGHRGQRGARNDDDDEDDDDGDTDETGSTETCPGEEDNQYDANLGNIITAVNELTSGKKVVEIFDSPSNPSTHYLSSYDLDTRVLTSSYGLIASSTVQTAKGHAYDFHFSNDNQSLWKPSPTFATSLKDRTPDAPCTYTIVTSQSDIEKVPFGHHTTRVVQWRTFSKIDELLFVERRAKTSTSGTLTAHHIIYANPKKLNIKSLIASVEAAGFESEERDQKKRREKKKRNVTRRVEDWKEKLPMTVQNQVKEEFAKRGARFNSFFSDSPASSSPPIDPLDTSIAVRSTTLPPSTTLPADVSPNSNGPLLSKTDTFWSLVQPSIAEAYENGIKLNSIYCSGVTLKNEFEEKTRLEFRHGYFEDIDELRNGAEMITGGRLTKEDVAKIELSYPKAVATHFRNLHHKSQMAMTMALGSLMYGNDSTKWGKPIYVLSILQTSTNHFEIRFSSHILLSPQQRILPTVLGSAWIGRRYGLVPKYNAEFTLYRTKELQERHRSKLESVGRKKVEGSTARLAREWKAMESPEGLEVSCVGAVVKLPSSRYIAKLLGLRDKATSLVLTRKDSAQYSAPDPVGRMICLQGIRTLRLHRNNLNFSISFSSPEKQYPLLPLLTDNSDTLLRTLSFGFAYASQSRKIGLIEFGDVEEDLKEKFETALSEYRKKESGPGAGDAKAAFVEELENDALRYRNGLPMWFTGDSLVTLPHGAIATKVFEKVNTGQKWTRLGFVGYSTIGPIKSGPPPPSPFFVRFNSQDKMEITGYTTWSFVSHSLAPKTSSISGVISGVDLINNLEEKVRAAENAHRADLAAAAAYASRTL